MIEGCYKYMGKEEFENAKPEIEAIIKERHPDLDFELEFSECMIACEDTSRVFVLVKDVEGFDEFAYGDEFTDTEKTIEELEEKYGEFCVLPRKVVGADANECAIGDFVIVDSEWGEPSVGIVTSVRKFDGKKYYGCSYFCVSFSRSEISMNRLSEGPVTLSSPDYGGLHTGFKKKLTKEEALDFLEEQITSKRDEAIEELGADACQAVKTVEKIIGSVGSGRVETVQSFKFIDYMSDVDESLRDNSDIYG